MAWRVPSAALHLARQIPQQAPLLLELAQDEAFPRAGTESPSNACFAE